MGEMTQVQGWQEVLNLSETSREELDRLQFAATYAAGTNIRTEGKILDATQRLS